MVTKIKKIIFLLIILIIGYKLLSNSSILGSPGLWTLNLSAKNVIVLDEDNNKVIYKLRSNKKIAPASTTKLLTALTALKYCKLDEVISVGDEVKMVASDASRAGLTPGFKLTVKEMLSALLLPSGNDAAYSLAVYTGRKISKDTNLKNKEADKVFVKEMNILAKEIGAKDSNFINPDGYDADAHYTTAYDMSLIAEKAIKDPVIAEIVKKPVFQEKIQSGQKVNYKNTNEMINLKSSYYNKNFLGMKTGTSSNAGHCLVSAFKVNAKEYIAVVMGSTDEEKWNDNEKIYKAVEKMQN